MVRGDLDGGDIAGIVIGWLLGAPLLFFVVSERQEYLSKGGLLERMKLVCWNKIRVFGI